MKVFLVGDYPKNTIRHLIQERDVSALGFEHLEQTSEPLAAWRHRGEDVVLLVVADWNSSSLDVVKRAVQDDIPTVVLTMSASETFEVEVLQSGAQDCLFLDELDSRRLIRSLRHAVERHRKLTELKRVHRQLQYWATHDALTGLPNRRLFFDWLSLAVAFGNRYDEVVEVAFLDLDGLKRINDEMGHSVGDELLLSVAKRLTETLRGCDTVARYGGDEFTFILRQDSPTSNPGRVFEKIQAQLSKPFAAGGEKVRLSASIGVSVYPQDGASPAELVQRADEAMYAAKRLGGGRCRFWSDLQIDEDSSRVPSFAPFLSPGIRGESFELEEVGDSVRG